MAKQTRLIEKEGFNLYLPDKNEINVRIYNGMISKYKSKGTLFGSNEKIYSEIMRELNKNINNIKEIFLALYLFNNDDLYSNLATFAKKGIKVRIVTIPLSGYDKRKFTIASDLYKRVMAENLIDLKIFPHMYVWYGALYAGGGAAYSFHIKAGLVTYKNEVGKIFLTSGNLARGDPTHTETAVFIEANNESPYIKAYIDFFETLQKKSLPIKQYFSQQTSLDDDLKRALDFIYIGKLNKISIESKIANHAYFTGPFIWIDKIGSNHYARKSIVDLVMNSQERILVCGQHVHDLSPFDGYDADTLISALIKKKRDTTKIKIRVLKQTSSKGLSDKRRAAFVECHLNNAKIEQKANRLVHDKFIVADNAALITTGNFTATNFGWGPKEMEYDTKSTDLNHINQFVEKSLKFFDIPIELLSVRQTKPRKKKPIIKIKKKDIFSEVNAYLILRDKRISDQFDQYFHKLWNHEQSKDIEIPM